MQNYIYTRTYSLKRQTNDVVWHMSVIFMAFDRHKNDVILIDAKNVRRIWKTTVSQ